MSNNLIDVHVLHMPNENQEWWKGCESSLVGHPINIHNCDGIEGNVGEARRLGFNLGSAPYVSFVDPDDIVFPDSFQICLDVLEQHPEVCGVYTLSQAINSNGIIISRPWYPYRPWSLYNMRLNVVEIHQIAVMRRECVDEYHKLDYPTLPLTNMYSNTMMYLHMALKKPWIAIDHIGYSWRTHKDGVHQKYYQHDDRKRAYDVMNKIYNTNL